MKNTQPQLVFGGVKAIEIRVGVTIPRTLSMSKYDVKGSMPLARGIFTSRANKFESLKGQ